MAKSSGKGKHERAKRTSAASSAASSSPIERVFAGAMETALRLGWRRAALADIADAAGMSLAELHANFADKGAILRGLVDYADRKVLEGTPKKIDTETSPRDRLFDVLMRRFDALRPYREGLAAVAREGGGIGAPGGVGDVICGAQRMLRSLAWMLEAAGIGSGGWAGSARVKGLGIVYAATFAAWLRDETEDMSQTMAALDRNLARAERLVSTFSFRRAKGTGETPAGSPA